MKRFFSISIGILLMSAASAAELVADKVDWQAFLGRHDLIWETLPTQFDYGAFLGNGLLGSMIYRDGDNRLRFEMGRADVTEHRRDNNRLPIGGLVLETVGKIQDGTMRLDLWNAEVRGSAATEKGKIEFRAFIHLDAMAMILDLETSDGEKDAKFVWVPGHGQDKRNLQKFKDPPNPAAKTETMDGLPVCIQPRFAGGEFATAWKEVATPKGRRVYLSIADSFPGDAARHEVVATVQKTAGINFDKLVASHRAWWHALYPKSFVSVPDAKLESFYWIQFYKLGCASRLDRVPVDLLGPWFRDTGWPRIWWNLNIQTLYLPVYAANQLELGESFVRFLDTKRTNFVRNAKEIWKFDDCATVPHTTCYEGLRGDGSCAPDHFINPGDFTWALQNYYQHYRHSMDHALVTNQSQHAFYPLLRGSVNLYLNLLKKGDDDRLHLPVLHSPEYGNAADNNYNLSLLRWACQTLIELNRRYRLNDPLEPRWRETLDKLVPYPVDATGLRIGADMAFEKSHRHWSHMLMVHPLHIMNCDEPANRELIAKSINHWLTVDGSRGVYGWSRAAAASLYSALGDGDNAIEQIHRHMSDKRFVRPNTMYIEGSPVIECSIVLARSLQDMLIQSWGDHIRIFPAIPTTWKSAIFRDMSAEGAFLVSAERKDGKTAWVQIKSRAGEPCRVKPGFDAEPKLLINGNPAKLKSCDEGVFDIPLKKGDEAFLFAGDVQPAAIIQPLPEAAEDCNSFGVKLVAKLTPALSSHKPAKASSIWSPALDALKAFDDDESTRWGAKPNSREGWLEVDLGKETEIGQVVIMEVEFPRTQEFAVEYQSSDTWKEIARGTTIGGVKTITFRPVTARRVRLKILKANEVPTLEEVRVLPPPSK